MSEKSPKISDPTRVRALAHPLRLELLDVVGNLGSATATQCAEQTGESVASCSFHLRMLAKYGYIEPAGRRGKEKPWRLVERSQVISPDWDDPSSVTAAWEFAVFMLDFEAERLRGWLERARHEPPEWVDATTMKESTAWLTRDELAEVSRVLNELTDRFVERRADPSKRPAGARLMRVFAATMLEPDAEVAR
jgi:DNA-binding transcriptional ArsR family regulator